VGPANQHSALNNRKSTMSMAPSQGFEPQTNRLGVSAQPFSLVHFSSDLCLSVRISGAFTFLVFWLSLPCLTQLEHNWRTKPKAVP